MSIKSKFLKITSDTDSNPQTWSDLTAQERQQVKFNVILPTLLVFATAANFYISSDLPDVNGENATRTVCGGGFGFGITCYSTHTND